MRILITGGGGFLAGHLADYLKGNAYAEVRTLKRAECDLAGDQGKLRTILRSFQPATIFHLAGRINGSEAELDCDNRLATVNLLDATQRECPSARIVVGSTAAVYAHGGAADAPLVESDVVCPGGIYAASKFACEQAAQSYAASGGNVVIARMSNPVGANMDASLLCGTLARQIVEIERGRAPVVTLRDLTPKRDFIPAGDCVDALWQLGKRGKTSEAYNVASGCSISIAEIVEGYMSLARVSSIEVKTTLLETERSPVREQWLSNAKLLELGWTPRQTLREAISLQLQMERDRA